MAYYISQADPKTEKKFLQTKTPYRPSPKSRKGGIAPTSRPPTDPPASQERPAAAPLALLGTQPPEGVAAAPLAPLGPVRRCKSADGAK